MTPPVHLTMSSSLVTSMLEEVVLLWEQMEEELILVTMDGHRLAASPSLLCLHSPLLSAILADNTKEAIIFVPGTAAQVSALLNLISRGESSFKSKAMLTEVKWLAADLGIDIFNIETQVCLGSETSSLAGEELEEEQRKMEQSRHYIKTTFTVKGEENILIMDKKCENAQLKGSDNKEIQTRMCDVFLKSRKLCDEEIKMPTYNSRSRSKMHPFRFSSLKCERTVFGTLLKCSAKIKI